MTEFNQEFTIPTDNLEALEGRVAEVNKKATKIGVTGLVMEILGYFTEIRTDSTGRNYDHPMVTVHLLGETPKYQGWAFVSSMEHTQAGSIIRSLPGMECPADQRDRGGECDHCGRNVARKYTFVLQHDDGAIKMVGRSCLKDFMGFGRYNPENIARLFAHDFMDLFTEIDEDAFGGGGSGPKTFDLVRILEMTGAAISAFGWASGGMVKSGEAKESTASHVIDWLFHNPAKAGDGEKARIQKMQTELTLGGLRGTRREEALGVFEWLATAEETGDYIHTLRVLAMTGYVKVKELGFACSMLSAWRTAMGREEEVNRREVAMVEVRAQSVHQGTIGERSVFTLKVIDLKELTSDFGVTDLWILEDEAGNRFKWFSSGSVRMEVDETVSLKATVKGHGEYNGVKETVITRGKLQEVVKS